MSILTSISILYPLGVIGIIMLLRLFLMLNRYLRCPADFLLDFYKGEELPIEPKSDPIPLGHSIALICKYTFGNIACSIILVATILSWFDVLLFFNREFDLNFQWLSEFYSQRMAILNIASNEVNKCFYYLHIFVGTAFIVEPLCEITYFKLIVSRLRPKHRMLTGLECYVVTKEIESRFYTTVFSLMSKPRKLMRKVLSTMGIFLTTSWILICVLSSTNL